MINISMRLTNINKHNIIRIQLKWNGIALKGLSFCYTERTSTAVWSDPFRLPPAPTTPPTDMCKYGTAVSWKLFSFLMPFGGGHFVDGGDGK